MSLAAGTRLGPYEIVAPLGAGGMGEVYRAKDTRLGREVAIKVLPAEVASDPERLRRFEQEAKAASALNHPNILTVHDVGAESGTSFLVTELLKGESLRELIRKGPLPPKRAVELALQIAKGLAAAHEKGIVHRDLKPENLFLTDDGLVKILDFGLARLAAPIATASQLAQAPTIEALTGIGMVVGTVGYMAPEQVRGEAADARADLFAFGCVLYELLAGQRAFARESAVDTLHAILHDEPPSLNVLASTAPPALADVLRHCLDKRREKRFQSAADLVFALEHVESGVNAVTGSSASTTRLLRVARRRWLLRVSSVVVVLLIVGLVFGWFRTSLRGGTPRPLDPSRVLVGGFENSTGEDSLAPLAAMAADAVTQGLVELGEVEVVPTPAGSSRRDEAALRTAARAAGAGTLVSGSYYLVGDTLEFRGRITDVESGEPLYALKPERGPRVEPATAIDLVRQRIMGALLLRLGNAPALGGLTTPPLHSAYLEYITAARAMGSDWRAVMQHLERAAEIDPEFWHPQIRLRFAYTMMQDEARLTALLQRLHANTDKFGPADRILMQYYDASLDGRSLEALRKARELLDLAPRDFTYIFAAADLALRLNRPREALACIGDPALLDWKVIGQFTQGTWLLRVAALAHHLLGEHETELDLARFGLEIYPDALNLRQGQVSALAALGRIDEIDRVIAESLEIRTPTQTPGDVLLTAALELRAHGHAEAARRIAAQGAAWYAGLTGEEAQSLVVALNRFEFLWLGESWKEAKTLVELPAGSGPNLIYEQGYRGILAAREGDRRLADTADRQLAVLDDARRRGEASWLRAGIAAQLGERDRSVGLLRDAIAHGFSNRTSLHVYQFLEPLHGTPSFEELLKPEG